MVFYSFGVLAVGISPALMSFIPALITDLVILVGMWLACEARRGKAGICRVVAVFALLASPSHCLVVYLLYGPFLKFDQPPAPMGARRALAGSTSPCTTTSPTRTPGSPRKARHTIQGLAV